MIAISHAQFDEFRQAVETRDACQAENTRLVLENRDLCSRLADATHRRAMDACDLRREIDRLSTELTMTRDTLDAVIGQRDRAYAALAHVGAQP